MSQVEIQGFMKGKVFLIGMTFVGQDGNLVEHYQTSGTVEELTDDGFLIFNRKNKIKFQLPYDERAIKEAEGGKYQEALTGDIIINPDYITNWKVSTNSPQEIEEIKEYGFLP